MSTCKNGCVEAGRAPTICRAWRSIAHDQAAPSQCDFQHTSGNSCSDVRSASALNELMLRKPSSFWSMRRLRPINNASVPARTSCRRNRHGHRVPQAPQSCCTVLVASGLVTRPSSRYIVNPPQLQRMWIAMRRRGRGYDRDASRRAHQCGTDMPATKERASMWEGEPRRFASDYPLMITQPRLLSTSVKHTRFVSAARISSR